MKIQDKFYHMIKSLLPRSTQIALRRWHIQAKVGRVSNVWPIDDVAGGIPNGWKGWPFGRRFAFVLTHDVEAGRGVERCLRLAKMEKELGFVSSFNFVPERYPLPDRLRAELVMAGFEVAVHDLKHDGRLFESERNFLERVGNVNEYLLAWNSVGFRSGSMYHNLDWMHHMKIEYDSSTFDTDPFEPQPDGMRTVFPVWIPNSFGSDGYVELPYTLPQDMTLFVLLEHKDTNTWKSKLEWIVNRGGMALLIAHPDYMNWGDEKRKVDEYSCAIYREFLCYVIERYRGQFWNGLPREVARCWRSCMAMQLNDCR
jgi:hypothetical protein